MATFCMFVFLLLRFVPLMVHILYLHGLEGTCARRLFALLQTGAGTAAVGGPKMLIPRCTCLKPFAKLSLKQREGILQYWASSPIPLLKKVCCQKELNIDISISKSGICYLESPTPCLEVDMRMVDAGFQGSEEHHS